MPNSPTIVAASLDSKDLETAIANLVKTVEAQTKAMADDFTKKIGEMNEALQTLGGATSGKKSARSTENLANSEKELSEAAKATNQALKERTMTLDQQSQAQQRAIRGVQKYSDEVVRQANEIREKMAGAKTINMVFGGKDAVFYDPAQSLMPANLRKSIEEQIISLQKEEQVNAERIAREEAKINAELEKERKPYNEIVMAGEERLNKELQALGIIQQQTNEVEKQKKKYQTPIAIGVENTPANKVVANMLGVKTSETKFVDRYTSSYKDLEQAVAELENAYSRMNKQQREIFGENLLRKMRQYQEAMREIKREESAPRKLEDIMAMSGNTLAQLADKMRAIQAYRSNINLNSSDAAQKIHQADNAYKEIQKDMNKYMAQSKQVMEINNALGRSWNYMKNRLAFYFTVGASTQFVKNLIEVRSQYEMNERALGILIDSAEKGTKIFQELSQMALVSPYTLIELSNAARQLTAYDVAAKDVVDTTRRLADMTSAVGIPIERLTYALGQIKAYGYLNNRDARMFANAGIPLVKELAEYYTKLEGTMVSTADVYDRMKKKAISYNDVMSVVTQMTDEGGKFFDYQAKMADTLKVQLANLTLAWNNMLNDIGKSEQWILGGGIKALKEMFLEWKNIERVLTDVAIIFGVVKAAQLILNTTLGKGVYMIKTEILANKQRQAAMLEQKALTQQLTATEKNLIATKRLVTAEDYKQILSARGITKQQALLLVAFKHKNVELMKAVASMGLLTKEEIANITVGKGLGLAVNSITMSLKGLVTTMMTLAEAMVIPAIIMAITDAFMYYNQQAEKTEEVNRNIANNAKNASEALSKYIEQNKDNIGTLTAEDAEKGWESLREQIELSSAAAADFISILMQEQDVAERLKQGFDVAESIRLATNAMAGLSDEALKISQDSWLGGLFGEGLAEDLEDYTDKIKELREKNIDDKKTYRTYPKLERDEAERELIKFADDVEVILRERLGDAGIADPIQLKEALERIKKEVKAENPIIKGEVEKYFDIRLDEIMAEKFQGVYNEMSSLQRMLIERIRRDSGSALKNLSDDILDTSKGLDEEVTIAIEKAFDKLENELTPEGQELLYKLQKEFDENPLMLRYLLLEAGTVDVRDAIQKDFDKHFGVQGKPIKPKKPIKADFTIDGSSWAIDFVAYDNAVKAYEADMQEYRRKEQTYNKQKAEQAKKYAEFNKKDDEDRVKWGKRILDSKKESEELEKSALHTMEARKKELGAQLSEEELLKDARYAAAKKDYQYAQNRKNAAQEVYEYEHLYNEEQSKNKGGSKKDLILNALKQEISLVEKLQSDYDKLTKSGASQADALATIREAYSETIQQLNAQLRGIGLPQLTTQLITGKDPNKALEYFKNTLATLVQKGLLNLERSKELEAVIEKLTISAKTYNLDKITKGLNSELEKLKDEYELAVELDANPELGSIFTELFDIDPNELPNTIEKYAENVTNELNKAIAERGDMIQLPNIFDIKQDDIKAFEQMSKEEILNKESFEELKKKWEEIRNLRKKDAEDTVRQTKDLQYKLADTDGKILIEKEKLAILEQKLDKETDEKKKELLRLQIEDQKNAIAKLGEEVLQMLPTYRKLFNSIFEHSAGVTRRIAKQWKAALESAKKNADGRYTVTDPQSGKTATVGMREYGNQIDKVDKKLRETESAFVKINKAFKGGKDDEKDYIKGIELIGQEAKKAADGLRTVAEIITGLSGDDAEELNDIADALSGIGDVTEGYAKLATDPIGGATQMIKGAWTAISAFIDNSDKKIQQKIKDSERSVKVLELAYVDFEHAVERAYGTSAISAKQLAIANKELQLQEMKRQLQLEESRKSKNRDEDRILDLKKQIKELQYEIMDSTRELVNELMGTDVGGFAENLVSSMISAFKQGEDYMKVFEDSFDNMIDNMIMKSIVSRVVEQRLNDLWDALESRINERSKEEAEAYAAAQAKSMSLEGKDNWAIAMQMAKEAGIKGAMNQWEYARKITQEQIDAYKAAAEDNEQSAAALYNAKKEITGGDIQDMMNMVSEIMPELGERLKEILGEYYKFGQSSETQLSALQQGIQGITEDTAGALEAYMNGVSQQVYLQSDLLTQIRDVVVGIDFDVQTATQAQMLLQLQQSYTVQMAIQTILTGVLTPSGRAFTVELAS